MMRIDAIEVRRLSLEMVEPFTTSFGTEATKNVIVVFVTSGDLVGVGECGASDAPFYSEETNASVCDILERFIIPATIGRTFSDPWEFTELFRGIRLNEMAKSTVETALWDLFAQEDGKSLASYLGGTKTEIPVGISVGIQSSLDVLVERVAHYRNAGYRRIKIKIKPGYDLEPVRSLREAFPDLDLMVDANSAYRLDDVETLMRLDRYDLMMIEQPLEAGDILNHSELARELSTPICLDESIRNLTNLQQAHRIGACSIVNLKIARVGGLAEALRIEQYCRDWGIGLWCGGLLETGIGRLYNIALTALEGFSLPGDTAPSARYFDRDVLVNPVVFSRPGYLGVPQGVGLGVDVDRDRIEEITVSAKVFR
jgi:O-succinylbenzoate synthase